MENFKNPTDALKFIEYLQEIVRVGDRTIKHYLYYYSFFDPDRLQDKAYLNKFLMRHKNNSIVRGMLRNYSEFIGITDFKLPKKSKGGQDTKRVVRSIDPSEIERVRKHLHNESAMKGLIFDLIYQGALRRVEVITITLGSFKWKEWLNDPDNLCRLKVLGKGKKERYVLINPETALMIFNKIVPNYNGIEETLNPLEKSEKLLFRKLDGSPLTEQNVYDMIKRGAVRSIGRDIRPHELRHNRATELLKRGIAITDIKTYLGHSKIATTEIYLHKSSDESVRSIAENLMK